MVDKVDICFMAFSLIRRVLVELNRKVKIHQLFRIFNCQVKSVFNSGKILSERLDSD